MQGISEALQGISEALPEHSTLNLSCTYDIQDDCVYAGAYTLHSFFADGGSAILLRKTE